MRYQSGKVMCLQVFEPSLPWAALTVSGDSSLYVTVLSKYGRDT